MSGITSLQGKTPTPSQFADTRPLVMADADRIFQRLFTGSSITGPDILQSMEKVSKLINETNTRDLPTFWTELEKELGVNSLSTKANTDDEKVLTALGLFYTALNTLDVTAVTTDEIVSIQAYFESAYQHVTARFSGGMEAKDKRVLNRMGTFFSERLNEISIRFNERRQAGEVSGLPLPTS